MSEEKTEYKTEHDNGQSKIERLVICADCKYWEQNEDDMNFGECLNDNIEIMILDGSDFQPIYYFGCNMGENK